MYCHDLVSPFINVCQRQIRHVTGKKWGKFSWDKTLLYDFMNITTKPENNNILRSRENHWYSHIRGVELHTKSGPSNTCNQVSVRQHSSLAKWYCSEYFNSDNYEKESVITQIQKEPAPIWATCVPFICSLSFFFLYKQQLQEKTQNYIGKKCTYTVKQL